MTLRRLIVGRADRQSAMLGNPPYNNFMGTVSHFNETQYAKELIEKYKEGLGEKKINIDDDYIKFIALGQNFIESNPNSCGILAYISNNSFLDGITHRQMRKVLLETFDKVYIVNLHGNARKKEKAPDGGKDENVFNIQVGTSINIFVKLPIRRTPAKTAKVYYVDLFGKRQEKYDLGKENLCLIVSRQVKLENWNHVFVANGIVERGVNFCGGGSGAPNVFPLYLYPPQEERRPNFNQEIVAKIEQIIGKKIKPEKLFDYIYAVLHSPKYRKDYEEFLKIDFPKIPYPVDNTEFERFAKLGQRLRELHLLEKIPKMKTTFPIADGNVVENIRFVDGKVYINKTQYFGNVPSSVWEFYVGGYQPLQKYLKDRKGRVLTFEEIQLYQKIVAVLSETETIMQELDC